MSNVSASSRRLSLLRTIALAAVVVLFAKVLVAILLEYRWYFPANFDEAAFLTGRESTFPGWYAVAFYAHIVCGPVTVVQATFLWASGGKAKWLRLHRWVGRVLMLLIFATLVPSGLYMAKFAFAGPIAGWGFAGLTLATGFTAAVAWRQARSRRFVTHRTWAIRCFILLLSPLLLRIISGGLIVLDYESAWAYRLNAWGSWLLPLLAYEVWRRYTWERSSTAKLPSVEPIAQEARP